MDFRQHSIKFYMIFTFVFILAASGITGCGAQSLNAEELNTSPSSETGVTLVLGDISDDPIKRIGVFQPLADYLAAHLREDNVVNVTTKIAPDIETMITWLDTGVIDLYFDSLYPAMMTYEQAGAQPILRRWKGGDAEYYSVFFTLADSNIGTLDDLIGHNIAFEEPFSTSGYMLPLAFMVDQGLDVVEVDEPKISVSDGKVGYAFSADDHNTIQWVVSGRVSAGVTDNQSFAEIPEEDRAELRIFAQTDPIPRQVVMASRHLDRVTLEAITQLLVDLDETSEGQEVLETFGTAQFDLFPEGGQAAISKMRTLYRLVMEQ